MNEYERMLAELKDEDARRIVARNASNTAKYYDPAVAPSDGPLPAYNRREMAARDAETLDRLGVLFPDVKPPAPKREMGIDPAAFQVRRMIPMRRGSNVSDPRDAEMAALLAMSRGIL